MFLCSSFFFRGGFLGRWSELGFVYGRERNTHSANLAAQESKISLHTAISLMDFWMLFTSSSEKYASSFASIYIMGLWTISPLEEYDSSLPSVAETRE